MTRNWVCGVAALAGAVGLAVALSGCAASAQPAAARGAATGAAATPPPTTAPSSSAPAITPGPSVKPSVSRPADCTASQLSADLNTTHTGLIAGGQRVVFDVVNRGPSPCWLSEIPVLYGVSAAGVQTRLQNPVPSRWPGWPSVPSSLGPGAVAPGADGVFNLDMDVDHCTTKAPTGFVNLSMHISSGDVTMPWPKQLSLNGCYEYVTQMVPLSAS